MQIVFATHNDHKLQEVQKLLSTRVQLITLNDINCNEELPENGNTLQANALEKARYVFKHYQANCFADDTGLEIEALEGRPGVYSARYAGEEKSAEKNMNKVLLELKESTNRKARFKTVIALILNNHEYLFEGTVEGMILTHAQGSDGFGYDPLFMPSSYTKTFAQMNTEEKNTISHRGIAITKLAAFLNAI
jgi:XTP/dITP diphosphohydrolase